MSNAFGIVNTSGNHIWVEGLQDYRPIGAFSFLGRYRVIDFPISNMSNSDIDCIQVYVRRKPCSLTEHLGTGRQYNINSKRGILRILFSENHSENDIYNTDISAFMENIGSIERMRQKYVVITPSYMVFTANFRALLNTHIHSGADITLMYHPVDNAREAFLTCDTLNLNRQKGLLSIERNRGNAKNKNIFMDTYVMENQLFLELIRKARKLSSVYTLKQMVNLECDVLDVRAVSHRGYFAAITDFRSYYDANISLIPFKKASGLFDANWPIYTHTNDSCPTQYFDGADVKNSVVSNGCLIEGSVENSVIGRGCLIKKGAVVKNTLLLPGAVVGENIRLENQIIDKYARLLHIDSLIAPPGRPGYVRKGDLL